MADPYPSLVLVQPRKTRPYITERLLMGRKESNQTKKTNTRGSEYKIEYEYSSLPKSLDRDFFFFFLPFFN